MNETVGSMELRLKKGVETATLCAYYGGLLTPKQRDALRLHYEEDLSLGEIAEEMNVTRQNVHELITRSGEKLLRYEKLLGCAGRSRALAQELAKAQAELKTARAALSTAAVGKQTSALAAASASIGQASDILADIIHQQEGEDDEHGI